MDIENAEWNSGYYKSHHRGRTPSISSLALRALSVGDVKRIIHDDVHCGFGSNDKVLSCSLAKNIQRLRQDGWILEYYHEATSVLVIRRLK